MHLNDHNAVIFLSRLKDLKAKYILNNHPHYNLSTFQRWGQNCIIPRINLWGHGPRVDLKWRLSRNIQKEVLSTTKVLLNANTHKYIPKIKRFRSNAGGNAFFKADFLLNWQLRFLPFDCVSWVESALKQPDFCRNLLHHAKLLSNG